MKFYKYHEFINEASITSVIDRIGSKENIEIENMDDYVNHFINIGAKRLAGGSSAEILEYKGSIIKIYAPINDPGMTRYLAFCLSNKTNPYIPKIEKILKVWDNEERWIFAIFMENLEKPKLDFINELTTYLETELKGYRFGNNKEDIKFFEGLNSIIMKHSKDSNKKSLNDIIAFLKGSIDKYKYQVDFGPQNWMMRGDQLVLIDPFWPSME